MVRNHFAVRQVAAKAVALVRAAGSAVAPAVLRMAVEAAVLVSEEAPEAVPHPPPTRQHPAGRSGTGDLLRN